MGSLDTLLARTGLSPTDRVLVAAMVAIAPGNWERVAECAAAARRLGVPRAELEETLLQAVLFYGFPRSVTAFEVLQRQWPAPRPPRGGALPRPQQAAAGRALFDAIYQGNRDAVLGMLASHHEELRDFVLEAAYGRILTRPGLDPRRRELLAVGALAALGQRPQLLAHARGALALGAAPVEVSEAAFTALLDDAAVARALGSG